MFKSLDPSDIQIREFKVFKSWQCDNNSMSSIGITIDDGNKDTNNFSIGDATNPDGSYKKLIWYSIRHLYYQSGSTFDYNSLVNYTDFTKTAYVSRSISDGIRIINIPVNVYGDQIKPTSVLIYEYSSSKYLVDDGNYNLYVSGTIPREIIGNVFYDTGHIIISSQSYTSSLDTFDLSFKSTVPIREYEVVCTVLESEFNYTTNLSAASGTSGLYKGEFISSSIKPFITTIGLYDDDSDLLMIGKLGKPYRRDYDIDTSFVLRIDL